MDANHNFITFILKIYIFLRRPRVPNFDNIIKITTTFIKTTLKD